MSQLRGRGRSKGVIRNCSKLKPRPLKNPSPAPGTVQANFKNAPLNGLLTEWTDDTESKTFEDIIEDIIHNNNKNNEIPDDQVFSGTLV